MAGTVVITEITHRPLQKVKFAWTSAVGGAASATTTEYYTGKIEGLTTVPSAVTAPSDNYSVAITDSDGVDVLMGGGATRDSVNTEHVLSTSLGCVVESKLSLSVTAAGDAKLGTVYVWIR